MDKTAKEFGDPEPEPKGVFRLKDSGKIVRLLEQTEIDKKLLSDILTRHGLKGKFENFTGER